MYRSQEGMVQKLSMFVDSAPPRVGSLNRHNLRTTQPTSEQKAIPILDVVLHSQVIDKKRVSKLGVSNSFVQRKAFGVKRDEAMAGWPVFHRLIEDHIFSQDNNSQVVKSAESL